MATTMQIAIGTIVGLLILNAALFCLIIRLARMLDFDRCYFEKEITRLQKLNELKDKET
jgi:hypothetical protein